MEFITKNAGETKEVGRKIADLIKNKKEVFNNKEKAIVLALEGNLGSGKTTFVQGLAEGLRLKQRIISPTFIILRVYPISKLTDWKNLYHIDLYRLENGVEQELNNLGVTEFWSVPGNLIVIEWAGKAKAALPDNVVWLNFENLGKNTRRIVL